MRWFITIVVYLYLVIFTIIFPSIVQAKYELISGAPTEVQMIFGQNFLGGLLIISFILLVATVFIAGGSEGAHDIFVGAWMGSLAGIIVMSFTSVIGILIYKLAWFAPLLLLAEIGLGNYYWNINQFNWAFFLIGSATLVGVSIILGTFFAWILRTRQNRRIILSGILLGLSVASFLQYLIVRISIIKAGLWFFMLLFAAAGIFGLILGSFFISPPKGMTRLPRGYRTKR